MIEAFTKAWFANLETMRGKFTEKHPEEYIDVVRAVVEMLSNADMDVIYAPDPARIHEIDHGGYSGTLVYVIGGGGYSSSHYWYVMVDYGSCSGCDTLQAIKRGGHYGEGPDTRQVDEYMALALHILQGFREMGDY